VPHCAGGGGGSGGSGGGGSGSVSGSYAWNKIVLGTRPVRAPKVADRPNPFRGWALVLVGLALFAYVSCYLQLLSMFLCCTLVAL